MVIPRNRSNQSCGHEAKSAVTCNVGCVYVAIVAFMFPLPLFDKFM